MNDKKVKDVVLEHTGARVKLGDLIVLEALGWLFSASLCTVIWVVSLLWINGVGKEGRSSQKPYTFTYCAFVLHGNWLGAGI